MREVPFETLRTALATLQWIKGLGSGKCPVSSSPDPQRAAQRAWCPLTPAGGMGDGEWRLAC